MNVHFMCRTVVLLLFLSLDSTSLAELTSLKHVRIVIDKEVVVAPQERTPFARNMAMGPDGTIWINSSNVQGGYPDNVLYKSTDQGQTWTWMSLEFPANEPNCKPHQDIAGFTVTRDGRLWIAHQSCPQDNNDKNLKAYVSYSEDAGQSWTTTSIDYGSFSPGAPEDPYVSMGFMGCHPNFLELPDGTLMVSASMRYADWNYWDQVDQTRPGIRDVMIRTTDGGKTWTDPTIVHQHATETACIVDPENPAHILTATRIQRLALPGEDSEAVRKITGSYGQPYVYKNGLLLESTDAGRTFREVPGGLFGFYSYRWAAVWTEDNVVGLFGVAGQDVGQPKMDDSLVARISLDGGRTWIDGTSHGTTAPNKATKFTLVPDLPGNDPSPLAATVYLGENRFLSTGAYKRNTALGDKALRAIFWYLEGLPQ